MILKIFLLISFSIVINAQEGMSRLRKPKIFYVSTHETSTTISTHTVCYKTSTAHTQCARKKRRSLEMVQKLKDAEVEIRASSVDIPEEDSLDEKVEDLLERSPEIPDLLAHNYQDLHLNIYHWNLQLCLHQLYTC